MRSLGERQAVAGQMRDSRNGRKAGTGTNGSGGVFRLTGKIKDPGQRIMCFRNEFSMLAHSN